MKNVLCCVSAAVLSTAESQETKHEMQRVFCPRNPDQHQKEEASGHPCGLMLEHAVCGSVGQSQSLFSKTCLCTQI